MFNLGLYRYNKGVFGLVLPTTSTTTTPTPGKWTLLDSTTTMWTTRGVCARPFSNNKFKNRYYVVNNI